MLAQAALGCRLPSFNSEAFTFRELPTRCPTFPAVNQLDGTESGLVSGVWLIIQDTFSKGMASDLRQLNLKEMLMPGIMSRLAPKVVSPKAHGIIDYANAGANLLAGALFRRRNPRASNAAFALGASILANALMTDYPPGVFRRYSFRVHGALDYGIAAASTSMPRLLGIDDASEARFFKWQGTGQGVFSAMTDYGDARGSRRRGRNLRDWRRAA